MPKADKDSRQLRDGLIDLETGVVDAHTAPELRTRELFEDRYVGVMRKGHELGRGKLTSARYAAGKHVVFSRLGNARGPIDHSQAALGLEREMPTRGIAGCAAACAT